MSPGTKADGPEATRILWTISRRLGMVVVLALAFLMSATVTIYLLFRIGDTRVPAIVGKSESEAQKMAEKAGLKVKIQHRNDAHIPENVVIESRPAPNSSVKKDSNVTIVVSSGQSQRSELLLIDPPGASAILPLRRLMNSPIKGISPPGISADVGAGIL